MFWTARRFINISELLLLYGYFNELLSKNWTFYFTKFYWFFRGRVIVDLMLRRSWGRRGHSFNA